MKRGWALAALLVACDDGGSPPPSEFRCGDDTACATGFRCDPGTLTCVRADEDVGRVPPPITPDAEPPRPDALPPDVDASAADAGLLDARTPDPLDAAPADAGPPDVGPDAAPPACQAEADPIPEAADSLADLTIGRTLTVGGPVAAGAFRAGDLDGDAATELVLARGGRAEALGLDGQPRWASPLLDVNQILALADLDGDGRREVVVQATRAVYILDGLTGAVLWAQPERPFGPDLPPVEAVLRVLVADATGDDLPDVYLTDSGCSGGGEGYGALFSFAGGFGAADAVATITGPRRGGRCARWQTLDDVDGDGRPELLRPDAVSLDAFDPTTGQRTLCGPIPDTLGDTNLPHFGFDHDPATPARDVAVFDRGRLLRLAPGPGPVADCPDDAAALHIQWQRALGDALWPAGSAAVDLDGDDRLDLLTSAWRGDRWWLVGVSGVDGQTLLEQPDQLALGAVPLADGVAVLVMESAPRQPPRLGRLQLLRLGPGAPAPLWPAPVDDAGPLVEPTDRPDQTGELGVLVTLGQDPRLLLQQADPGETSVARLLAVDAAGAARALPLAGAVGGVHRVCAEGACADDRVVVALEDGAIALLDADLTVLNAADGQPAARAPTGTVAIGTARDGASTVLVTLTAAGVLGGTVLAPGDDAPPPRWRVQLANGTLPQPGALAGTPRRAGADLFVLRDRTRDATGWRAVTADGQTLWLDRRDPTAWQLLGGGAITRDAQGNADVALRYDQVRDLATLIPDPNCEQDREDADLRAPLDACPQAAPTARVITALDAETGRCRWRTALRPARCGNPSNQNISLADADGDGRDEIYVTATNELIRLDPADGQVLARVEIGFIGASGRGGGFMLTGPPLVRFAGNGPVDAWDADLGLLWRAALAAGARGQTWLGRPVAFVGAELWASPGPADPLHRYPLAAQGEDVAPAATIALADGRLADDGAARLDVHSLQPVPEALTDGSDGILVTGDDGWLYALDAAGGLGWSRRYPAVIGPVVVHDLDGDGDRELAVPLNDGRVQIADLPGPPPPRARWDLPCPPIPTCDPAFDIDETRSTTTLCGEWLPSRA
ncbi:MAG: PQQ-binding-like beta-propeller repeat protein [bacterium]